MTSANGGLAWRISLQYAALFVVPGIYLPFFSVWLRSRGLTPTEISIMLSVGILVRLIAGPLAAHAVDRSGRRKAAIVTLAWASAATLTLFGWVEGFAAMLIVWVLHTITWAPITPFTDNIALLATARHQLNYGRMRLWGSLSFLAAAYLAGLWLEGRPESWIYILLVGGILLLAACSHLLPDIRLPLDKPRAGLPLLRLLRRPAFLLFMLTTACLQASHAAFYTFGTLHWRSLGHSDAAIGWLWAEGVIAEVVLFAFAQRIPVRFGGAGLLVIAALGGLVRWSTTVFAEDYLLLTLLQLLHAATFGAAHLGAMRLLSEGCAPNESATAQTLYVAGNSAMLALATLAVGPLFAAHGGGMYWLMSLLSCCGGGLAMLLWRRRALLNFSA
ncbi:MAG TPA: MFS transporter [Ferrovibrio sp.]|uniref:MFS transporter n=1 Tax=Ferrovibrio sp. TaxID=1917215 RepID=UPI002ED3725C